VRLSRIRDDEVESVVAGGLFGDGSVLRHHVGDARATVLAGERHNGRGAAAERGNRCAVEVVTGCEAGACLLLDVAVGIDPTGRDDQAGGVDDARPALRQATRCRDFCNHAALDTNVCDPYTRLGHDTPPGDHQVERRHRDLVQ
jgi:hypothetical protein